MRPGREELCPVQMTSPQGTTITSDSIRSDGVTARRTIERYELGDEIGSGGMGSVHLGRLHGSAGFRRLVAIKKLHPEFATDPNFVKSLIKEARLAARIRHPNVVPILDTFSDGRELFLVLEYVHGESLHWLLGLEQHAPAPVPIVAAVVRDVLEGLHSAHHSTDELGHRLEIIHRDVSPQNVLVGVDGHGRITDFGIAVATGRATPLDHKGKLSYMAPEQLVTGTVSPRSDVYSASVVLWEALTGRRLFRSNQSFSEMLEAPIPPPSSINPEVPAALDEAVLCGIERNPALRFGSAREMSLAIEQALPLPTEREIGMWVDLRAGSELADRAMRIAAIERGTARTSLHDQAKPEFDAFDRVLVTHTQSAAVLVGLPEPGDAAEEETELERPLVPTKILPGLGTPPAAKSISQIIASSFEKRPRRWILVAAVLLVLLAILFLLPDRSPATLAATRDRANPSARFDRSTPGG
jgi:eukaryotic-like serine/threonine-protein kinase